MKNISILVLALTGTLLCTTPVYAGKFAQGKDGCFEIDLRTGSSTHPPNFIEFVVPPEDSDGDGWLETVVKVRVNDPGLHHFPEAVTFRITYDGDPNGMSVNIGDSKSNDGGSGDAGDQSNDAELQIGTLREGDPSLFNDLLVFGRDGLLEARGSTQIAQVVNIAKKGEIVDLTIANERLKYNNNSFPISGNIHSTWLYALKGQSDSEGPVNYDIFAAFNRVINVNSNRLGSGVGKVEICPVRLKDGDRDSKADEVDYRH